MGAEDTHTHDMVEESVVIRDTGKVVTPRNTEKRNGAAKPPRTEPNRQKEALLSNARKTAVRSRRITNNGSAHPELPVADSVPALGTVAATRKNSGTRTGTGK